MKTLMKFQRFIVILIMILISLVLIDILTGIYFWNRDNLSFCYDCLVEFLKDFAPLAAFVGVGLYAGALYRSFEQNKIIRSNNLRPFYEGEIERIKSAILEVRIDHGYYQTSTIYNGLEFPAAVNHAIIDLSSDSSFNNDSTNSYEFKYSEFKEKHYYDIASALLLIDHRFKLGSHVWELIDLGQSIKNSSLTKEDKERIFSRVRHDFSSYYWYFDRSQTYGIDIVPEFKDSMTIHFTKLKDSSIGRMFVEFQLIFNP